MSTVVGSDGITYTLKTGDESFTTDLTINGNVYTASSGTVPNGYVLNSGTVTNVVNNGKLLAGGGVSRPDGSSPNTPGGSAFKLIIGSTVTNFKNYGSLLGGGGGSGLGTGGIGGGGAGSNYGHGGSIITGINGVNGSDNAGGGGGPGGNGGGNNQGVGSTGGGAPGTNGTGTNTTPSNTDTTSGFTYGGGGGRAYSGHGGGGGYGGGNGASNTTGGGGGGGGGGLGGSGGAYGSGANGGYSIYSLGAITNLYNRQGGKTNRYGPLFYGGVLPTNYYIRLDSQTSYGQLYCTGWSWLSGTTPTTPIMNIDPTSSFVPTSTTRFYNALVGNFTTASMSSYSTPRSYLSYAYSWYFEKQVAQTTIGTVLYDVYDLIISSAPTLNTSATALTAFSSGTYRHVAMTILGTTHTLYLDGVAVATNTNAGNVFSTYSSLTNLYLGSAADLSFGYTGIIDDFKIWNRALPAADIISVYANNNPNLGPIDYLSSTTKTAMLNNGTTLSAGAYGVRLLYSKYSGPVMTIRRSSDSASSDFYVDANGNLGTGYLASGTSLTTWLNGATAYVTQWWDQTGNSNHATQSTTANQPTYNTTNNYITFPTNAFFNLPSGTHPYGDNEYTYITKYNSSSKVECAFFGGGSNVNYSSNGFIINNTAVSYYPGSYVNYWYGYAASKTFPSFAVNTNYVASVTFSKSSTRTITIYNNGVSLNADTPNPSVTRIQPNTGNVLGADIQGRYMNGNMYYMYIAPIAVSDADRNKLEATPTNNVIYIPPILSMNFENNLNNSGTGVGISSLSLTQGTLEYPTGYKGVYCANFTYNYTPNPTISFTFTNATFPISYSFWMKPAYVDVCYGVLSVGYMYFAINGAGSITGINGAPSNDPNNTGPRIPGLLTFYSSSFSTYTDNVKYYSTAGYQNTSGFCCSANVWTHIVWVANSSTSWTVYVNKVPYNIDGTANPLSFASSVSCTIGPGKRNWYNGLLDNFQLYNGYALTQTDVNNLYTN